MLISKCKQNRVTTKLTILMYLIQDQSCSNEYSHNNVLSFLFHYKHLAAENMGHNEFPFLNLVIHFRQPYEVPFNLKHV